MRKICGNSLLKQRSGFFVFGFLVAYLSCGLLPAAAWTDVDHAYRTADPASEDCQKLKQNPSALSGVNNDETRSIADPWWNCTIQRHENPPPIGSNSFAASTVRVIHDPSAYNLAFVEFGEEGQELNTNQRRLLFEHLQAQKQNYVVVFVHGWRDDAQRGNGNLMNFRMLLSYTKSALESRCVEAGRYCDATLTGVYIGWRGQALSEDGNDWWSSAKAAFTLFTRKPTSERIAGGVAAFLNDLSRTLDTRSASVSSMFARDHMLTIGHSLGGNVLITGFGPDILASINALKDARNLRAPAGDLIVLLNPAAEASKWTRLQDAVVSRGANLFAPNQTPVLLSLTATCHYPDEERQAKDLHRKIDCDTATSKIFPAFKLATFDPWPEDRTTIGNLDPDGDKNTRTGHGTTHEFDMNGAPYTTPAYALASDPNYAQCRISDGWMTYAKQQVESPEVWDAGYLTQVKITSDDYAVDPLNDAVYLNVPEKDLDPTQRKHIADRDLRVRGQFMHGIYRHQGPVITGPDDPFWNVRAIDSAVQAHTGIFSPMTWCALHQLVLDDVAGTPLYAKDKLWKPRTLSADDAH